jgi:hypothetical protein
MERRGARSDGIPRRILDVPGERDRERAAAGGRRQQRLRAARRGRRNDVGGVLDVCPELLGRDGDLDVGFVADEVRWQIVVFVASVCALAVASATPAIPSAASRKPNSFMFLLLPPRRVSVAQIATRSACRQIATKRDRARIA